MVGLELPGWLTEPLGWVGLTWPQADEVKLFEAGQAWISFATTLRPIAQSVDQAAVDVWTTNEGTPADAFRRWWTDELGPRDRLADDALAAMVIGAGLILFAAVTLAMKIAFLVQLVTLAILVGQAIATAFLTFGATTVEIPVFIAATRLACQLVIRQGVKHIDTGIAGLLQRAATLLRPTRSLVREGEHVVGGLGIPAPLKRDVPLPTKDLLPQFRGEAAGYHPDRPFGGRVEYFSPEKRESHRLFVRDGRLHQAVDGKPFDTSSSVSAWSPDEGRAIFVMDRDGNLYASKVQRVGRIHHSSLLAGDSVVGAGELRVEDGTLNLISRKSGHYQPTTEQIEQVLLELERQGLPMRHVQFDPNF